MNAGEPEKTFAFGKRAYLNELMGHRLDKSSGDRELVRSYYIQVIDDYKRESEYPDKLLLPAIRSIISLNIKIGDYSAAKGFVSIPSANCMIGGQEAEALIQEINRKSSRRTLAWVQEPDSCPLKDIG